MLELNQLAAHQHGDPFWLHSKKRSNNSNLLGDLLLKWARFDPSVKLNQANFSFPLPPSSVYSFEHFNGSHIETAVLSNHEGPFTNRYYHSLFDQASNIMQPQATSNSTTNSSIFSLSKRLSAIATVVSRALAEFLHENIDPKVILADVNFTAQLVDCIFVNPNCTLFHQIQRTEFYNECKF